MAHKLAQENPNITADVVEATEFPALTQRYNVMAVPKTVINESKEFTGAYPEDRFVDEILQAIQ